MSTREPVLTLERVCAGYGSHRILNDINLQFAASEFVALLGPNGAGKSTLIKLLDGLIEPQQGRVTTMSNDRGLDSIAVLHQDLALVEDMSVAENLWLAPSASGPFLRVRSELQRAAELLKAVGLSDLDPSTLIRELSLGERGLVATARLLATGANVLIVDEVTANLPPTEAAWLVEHLRQLASGSVTVIFVTHRLAEIVGLVDRYVVLIDGRVVHDVTATGIGLEDLRMMTMPPPDSSEESLSERDASSQRNAGDLLVELRQAKTSRVGPVSLSVSSGQVVGVTGLAASGLHDVAYLMSGHIKPTSGEVVVSPLGAHRSCVPARREIEGTFPLESMAFNIAAGNTRLWRRGPVLSPVRQDRDVERMSTAMRIVPNDTTRSMETFSGGNQQKGILARALMDAPNLIVMCEPTRGVDVSTREQIYELIRVLRANGAGILLASSDRTDLLAVADEIAILDTKGLVERVISPAEFQMTQAV